VILESKALALARVPKAEALDSINTFIALRVPKAEALDSINTFIALSFCFPMVKLLDYQEKLDELEKSRNPFSMVVRVHLKALETQKSPQQRLNWKKTLYQALYEENDSEKEIMGLLVFLDWLLTLPNELAQQFNDFVGQYEEAKKMDYVTTWERKGIEKGILQKSRESVTVLLDTRFQQVPKTLVQTIQAIDDTSLLSKDF